ncbi:MAG: carboxypeptidase-like regulatory domain-containing protein [Alistipes indistinctus]
MTLVQAQERTYSGVVKGSDGQPIIGASVEVVGTTVGTSTGLDGDYTIKAKQGSKIKYSFLGTKSVTATAGASSTINVTLEDDAMGLEEVVVQAFGTAKKKT